MHRSKAVQKLNFPPMGDFSISRLFVALKYKGKQRAVGSILSQVPTWTIETEKKSSIKFKQAGILIFF